MNNKKSREQIAAERDAINAEILKLKNELLPKLSKPPSNVGRLDFTETVKFKEWHKSAMATAKKTRPKLDELQSIQRTASLYY